MTTEAASHGQAAHGTPTNGESASATIPEPTEIRVVVESGSSPTFIRAFQPAWHAAANKTAKKTKVSMRSFIADPDTAIQQAGDSINFRHPGTVI